MMTGEIIFRHTERVMGTVVSFDVRPRGLPYARTRAALALACQRLHRADAVFSLYRADSPLSRMRRGELALAGCPPEVAAVLELCQSAREQSGGWFDPWAMAGGVDPTGLVKGWAAQQAANALQAAGVDAALVNAAGDIAGFGRPSPDHAWQVGVRAPEAPEQLLCVLALDGAVATSGNYERGDHVRDARSGAPASAAVSATVCGPDLAFADAFATGLLSAGEAGLESVQRAGYHALLVMPDARCIHTPAFPITRRGATGLAAGELRRPALDEGHHSLGPVLGLK